MWPVCVGWQLLHHILFAVVLVVIKDIAAGRRDASHVTTDQGALHGLQLLEEGGCLTSKEGT